MSTLVEEFCLFSVCFGGDVWVGFAGSAGFNGDFDDGFSSISWVVRPAAETKYENTYIILLTGVIWKSKNDQFFYIIILIYLVLKLVLVWEYQCYH